MKKHANHEFDVIVANMHKLQGKVATIISDTDKWTEIQIKITQIFTQLSDIRALVTAAIRELPTPITLKEAIEEAESAFEEGECKFCGGIPLSLEVCDLLHIDGEHTNPPCSHYIVNALLLQDAITIAKSDAE